MKSIFYSLVLIVIVGVALFFGFKNFKFSTASTSVTATRIDQVKEIGQWEFLTVYAEEMVDTQSVKHNRFWMDSHKELVRIYSGTLRFGLDLKKDTKENWIVAQGDTVTAVLPHTHLLDERFLDEAATRSVIENGSWSHADKGALYNKAVRIFKQKYLTKENLQRADEQARTQVETLLRNLGFKHITVTTN